MVLVLVSEVGGLTTSRRQWRWPKVTLWRRVKVLGLGGVRGWCEEKGAACSFLHHLTGGELGETETN